jgi:23S rRNA pseudouridine2605 synthase
MAGRASRREAERLLVAGRIQVNGTTVTVLGTRVVPGRDRVELDGEAVVLPQPRWIAFHKPPGVLTTRRDPHGGTTVYDVLPEDARGLRYVGRLDRPTEGLLLLSNEGDVVHGLLHPSRGVEREYRVTVKGLPSQATLRRLESGVTLEDGPARAVAARLDVRGTRESRLTLVLAEGRKREVRRMMEAVGHGVLRLVRVRFGPVVLGDLPPGAWRPLTTDETGSLRALARGR